MDKLIKNIKTYISLNDNESLLLQNSIEKRVYNNKIFYRHQL